MAWRSVALGTTERMPIGLAWQSAWKKRSRLPDVRQRLRVAQVRMHVHEPDLAAEEGRALGALEHALRAAVVGHRPIEQPHAVRAARDAHR